jgi:hypothetical protein
MRRFLRELREAKRRGVNVVKIFHEEELAEEEKKELAHVRSFGLKLAVIWVFFAPIALVVFEVYCEANALKVSVPHDLIYWTCATGFISILAFGYDLIDIRTLTGRSNCDTDDDLDTEGIDDDTRYGDKK